MRLPIADQERAVDRRRGFSVARQGRVLLPLAGVWAVGMVVLAIAVLGGPVREVLPDASFVLGGPWYIGIVSQFGIVCWAGAAASGAWASWWSWMDGRMRTSQFLGAGALVTVVLLLDDLVGLHSGNVAGLSKAIGLPLVVGPAVAWVVVFAREIARTRWIILFSGIVASVGSVAVDALFAPTERLGLLVEDGSKFLGILAWAAWFVLTSADIARSVLRSATAGAPMGQTAGR